MKPLADAVVLLTGGSGFLGRHLCARLRAAGCRLHAVGHSRTPEAAEKNGVTWHSADLRDPDAAVRLVRAVEPTHLLHGAWIATPGVFWYAPENTDWLYAGAAMLGAFGEIGGKRFVGVGSCTEYDWHCDRFVEDETPIRPATLYGKAKAAMWTTTQTYAVRYGFAAAWGRVFFPFGPGEAAQRLVPTLIENLQARRQVPLTEGTQERDFIFAPDAADLLVRLLDSDAEGVFNIGTGRATSVRRMAAYVGRRMGGEDLLHFGARATVIEEPPWVVADMAKVTATFGRQAPTTVEEGLDAVLDEVGVRPRTDRESEG